MHPCRGITIYWPILVVSQFVGTVGKIVWMINIPATNKLHTTQIFSTITSLIAKNITHKIHAASIIWVIRIIFLIFTECPKRTSDTIGIKRIRIIGIKRIRLVNCMEKRDFTVQWVGFMPLFSNESVTSFRHTGYSAWTFPKNLRKEELWVLSIKLKWQHVNDWLIVWKRETLRCNVIPRGLQGRESAQNVAPSPFGRGLGWGLFHSDIT